MYCQALCITKHRGIGRPIRVFVKLLQLIDDDGKPAPMLHALAVADEAVRKEQLKKILQDRYSALFALDLVKTTPAELAEKLSEVYKVTGDTREKAIRFFLAAVAYVGIRVSPLLARVKTTGLPGKKRQRKATVLPTEIRAVVPPAMPEITGTSRVVQLKSGGTFSVSSSIWLFALIPGDRKFLFELIEKLEAYEQEHGAKPNE